MQPNLKILFIEDVEKDYELLLHHLEKSYLNPVSKRVETEKELVEALRNESWDLVISDYMLPRFNVLTAISLVKHLQPDLPCIVISGAVGEEKAVETMRAGAHDYILKGNLARLVPIIQRELADAETLKKQRQTELALKNSEENLRQAQKMEAVGQLAGGIAHDFNNMLAVILISAEISIERYEEDPELKKTNDPFYKSFEQIKEAGNKAASLTRQLLAFSRKQIVQPKVLDINESVREMEKMLSRLIEEKITFGLELDENCKKIKMDQGQLEQILMNLVVNSRDAMPKGGKITIKTENSSIDDEMAKKTNTKPGSYTLLRVTDTGEGMSEEIQKHIFDPFFTTKEIGKGTGLGLSTVYGIIKQNNGLVFVESTLNVGTTFKVYFQQTDEGVKSSDQIVVKVEDLQGAETILVAEDDKDLREIVCQLLKKLGYTVLEARDGVEALEHIKSYQKPIHLVITDVVMPNMGGRELSEKAQNINFNSAFLFLSGYTEDVLLQQGIKSGQSYFLDKPFTKTILLNKVRSVLELAKNSVQHH